MTQATAKPRIAPVEPPYDAATEEMLRKWMPPGAAIEPLALFRTLTVHDELSSRMRVLGAGILGHGRIEPREREIIVLRTCALAGAEYEWGVHVVAFARPAGLTDQQIASTVTGDEGVWSNGDWLLIRLADEIHETCGVSEELWAALAQRYRDDQLLELVVIAGWYRLISAVINAVGIDEEPWAARFPATPARAPSA
jgi:4-carboxymuconolactone decarboxylase